MEEIRTEERAMMLSVLKHDIGNTLTSVLTGLEMLSLEENIPEEELKEDLRVMTGAARRMQGLVSDLGYILPELRPAYPRKKTELALLFEELAGLLEAKRICLDYGGIGNTMVYCDQVQLLRCFFHLSVSLAARGACELSASVSRQDNATLVGLSFVGFSQEETETWLVRDASGPEATDNHALLARRVLGVASRLHRAPLIIGEEEGKVLVRLYVPDSEEVRGSGE
ncbi:MAG: hypothetical protein HQL31_05780 [Planctomycetes bacterium]|nr:hypothetical protein [Planctomycetota bacterium]